MYFGGLCTKYTIWCEKYAEEISKIQFYKTDKVLLFPFPFPTGISRVLHSYFHSSQIYNGAVHSASCLEN